jgi:hypothetical protein
MAEKSTARSILKLTEKAVAKFTDGVQATQNGILRKINGVLRRLELSGETIKPNSANIRTLRTLRDDLTNIIVNDAYLKKVETFTRNFSRIKRTTDQFYRGFQGFNGNKNVFKDLLAFNLDRTKTSLTQAGINNAVIDPVLELVNNGVTSGMNINDMEAALRTRIIGDSQRLGGLERYSKQITRDALNQYSRNYNESISMDLGLEWYYYSGSIIDDTRSYCVERAGKYFHKNEVEDVPSDWAGMIPGTNSSTIFTYAGGYNCRHLWLAVMIDVVPRDVIDRNIANGNYKQ